VEGECAVATMEGRGVRWRRRVRGLRQRIDDGRRGCAVEAVCAGFATEGQWGWAPQLIPNGIAPAARSPTALRARTRRCHRAIRASAATPPLIA
jgi:hypothetical protein